MIDDGRKIGVGGKSRIEAPGCRRRAFRELLDLALGQQDVIGRNAGLAGVDQLAKDDARDRMIEIGAGTDDGWRFAAQLKRHRSQIVACRAHDVTTDGGRARKQQMVERQRGKRARDIGVAGDDQEIVGGESFSS